MLIPVVQKVKENKKMSVHGVITESLRSMGEGGRCTVGCAHAHPSD